MSDLRTVSTPQPVRAFLFLPIVLLCLLFASCSAKAAVPADSPSETVTEENMRAIIQTLVDLHERVAELELQQLGHLPGCYPH